MSRLSHRATLAACVFAALPGAAAAGSFIQSTNNPPAIDSIMHVRGYPTGPNPAA